MYYIIHPPQMFFRFTFRLYVEMGPRHVARVCLGLMVLLLQLLSSGDTAVHPLNE